MRHDHAIAEFIGLLALLLVFACSREGDLPPDAPRVPDGLSGRLLFTWKDGLETLDLSTGRMEQLAPAPPGARITGARWSPSGTGIAYAVAPQEVRAPTRPAVFVATADGSGARAVAAAESPSVFYHWPTWDADGSRLYVLRADPSAARIERIDVATGEGRTVVDRAADFDVSRDGRLLAFVRTADAGATLNLLRLGDEGGTQVLTSTRPFQAISAPRFTPGGRAILFSLSRPQELEALTHALPRLATWLGVGAALAHGLPQDLYSVPVEGGPLQLVVRLGADDPVAAWSPDAARVAVLTPASLGITSSGGSLVPVLAPGGYGSVDWAP